MAAAGEGERSVRAYRAEDLVAVTAMLVDRDPWRRLGYMAGDWERLLTVPLAGREGWVIERSGTPAGFALLRLGFLVGDYLELFAIDGNAARSGSAASYSPRSSVRFSRAAGISSSASPTSTPRRAASTRARDIRTSVAFPTS